MTYKVLIGTYLVFLFSCLLFINLYYLEGIPHVPDSAAYLFMAKIFSTGNLVLPIPVSPEHFDFFPGILSIQSGQWLFQYSFGHPLILTLGVLIGFPNIIPPLIGSAFVFILFLIAKKIYDLNTAIILLFLPIISPFFLSNASSFMSHNTAAFYLVSAFYFLISYLENKRKIFLIFLSGLFLGLLFNTRPLTALPFIIVLLTIILLKRKLVKLPEAITSFFLSMFFMLALWFLYNFLTTGDLFSSQYFSVNKHLFYIENNFFKNRIENFLILLKNFGPILFNWPQIITYAVIILPFILRKNNFWDNIFFFSIFTLPFVYFFYNGIFIMYGPRFWYEILPFILLLTARSFGLVYKRFSKSTIVVFVILLLFSIGRLFSFIPSQNPNYFSPLKLKDLKGFNFVDNRIFEIIEKQKIHNAVIFIKDCNYNWWCYGSVFFRNSPRLNTDLVYAKDLGDEKNRILINYFKNKSFYKIDYYNLNLEKIEYLKY